MIFKFIKSVKNLNFKKSLNFKFFKSIKNLNFKKPLTDKIKYLEIY
jgi:hypothetical protein